MSGSMVHVNGKTIEVTWKECYSNCDIDFFGVPANIWASSRFKAAWGSKYVYIYPMNIFIYRYYV